FNPAPGGPGALVGISWLPLIFGIYFAMKLTQAGDGPASAGRAVLYVLLGAGIGIGGATLWARLSPGFYSQLLAVCVMFPVGALIAYRGWPALGKTLFAYA